MGEEKHSVLLELKAFASNYQRELKLATESTKNFKGSIEELSNAMKKDIDEDLREQAKATASLRGAIKNINGEMDISNRQLMGNIKGTERQTQIHTGFLETLQMDFPLWQKANKERATFTTVGGRVGNTIRNMTQGMKGFRMELLSVMFFGMAMQRMFMGLLGPALEVSGMFELISATLEIVFLPIALLLLEALLPVLEWFMELPDEVKLAIGAITIIVTVLGMLLAIIGTVGLGIGGLIAFFGGSSGLISILGMVAGAITGLIGAAIVPLMAILGLLLLAWMGNSEGIMKALGGVWEGVKKIFGGIMDIFSGFIDFLTGVFTGDTDKAIGGLKKIFEGLTKIVDGVISVIKAGLIDLPIAILQGIGKSVITAIGTIADMIGKAWQALMDKFPILKQLFGGATQFVSGFGSGVNDFVKGGGLVGLLDRAGIKIPGFAAGGIVTSPTLAMVGEKGPELITPLNGSGSNPFSPTINITINASTGMGVTADEIARVVESRLGDELRRMSTFR